MTKTSVKRNTHAASSSRKGSIKAGSSGSSSIRHGGLADALPVAKPKSPSPRQVKTVSALSIKTPTPSLPEPGTSKLAQVTAMLRTKQGASLAELMQATGWQAHSVRGALSGSIKKKQGLAVSSTRVDGERRYRIEA